MVAFYNEIDPFAAAWLRELIARDVIAPGIVDERSIEDVCPDELAGFTQCHFFAGIGVHSYALRRAGWPDDRPIWTGSCPCQPFSAAGKGEGFADERHLWPAFYHLIEQCEPTVVAGEQVASGGTGVWFDLVQADLEAMGYAFGLVPLPAAGFGGAHIRDRAFWVADAMRAGWETRWPFAGDGSTSGLRAIGGLADAAGVRYGADSVESLEGRRQLATRSGDGTLPIGESATGSPMLGRDLADWLFCRDGKWRPVGPGTFPLAHEAPARVGRLRGYGNAIDAETLTQFYAAVIGSLSPFAAPGEHGRADPLSSAPVTFDDRVHGV